MKSDFRILLDLDGVLDNLCTHWVRRLNDILKTDVDPDKIRYYNIYKNFPIPEEEVSSIAANVLFHNPVFWEGLKPIPDSTYYVDALLDDGFDVRVVSSSSPETVVYKHRFLQTYFPRLADKLIITNDKSCISGDVLVDDYPDNLRSNKYKCILFDASYNRTFDNERYGILRARDWEEAYIMIQDYYRFKLGTFDRV